MSAAQHAAEWEALAAEADQMGDWERSRGRYDGAYRNRAESYRKAAKSLQLEAATGVPHCACCHKPLSTRAPR